ncbi:hypothetical protein [Chitinophaga tropicalis]|uniref:Uncharacterized protein n=1 Tax=Chitinophaga tropicalis TaxID=2683588 RepID=A0A7K1U9B3_9BACT|nr:hypothetical protein [Chitinophaga tropicalis]MVT10888.1 hypothetical protein [Chitinophaga tropicalis]
MATQNTPFPFIGKLGNLIGYRRNKKYFLRSMPEIVRQTRATRRAAQRFGMASKKGALIRSAFYGKLDVRADTSHINRLTKALIPSAGNNTKNIIGFRFNKHTGTDRFFALAPRLSADGILHIPSQTLPAFKDINMLEVKVIATRISFATHQVVNTQSDVLIIDSRKSFSGASFSVDVPGKGTLVVTLQVRGLKDNLPSGNGRSLAADIVAVQPPQTGQVFHKPAYLQHPISNETSNTVYPHFLPFVIQRE